MGPVASFPVALKTRDWALSKNISVHFISEVGSTNSWAKEDSAESATSSLSSAFSAVKSSGEISRLSLFLTENQTGGRGRNQNHWLAKEPQGQLFSSWVYELSAAPQPVLSPLVGLALHKSLRGAFGDHFALKAPNDIYIGDKKIAGILIESVQTTAAFKAGSTGAPASMPFRLIIGIGLNVFTKPDLPSAGCLKDKLSDLAMSENWEKFLDFLSSELSQLTQANAGALSPEQRKDLLQALNQFSLLQEKYVDVLEDGSLKLKTNLIHWSDL